MTTLAFDGRMGASGDMLLGALIAAGANPAVLGIVEDVLDVEYRIGETTKNGIRATTVDVLVSDAEASDTHDHSHSHDHDHDHDHSHDDERHAEGDGSNRTYAECRDLVREMGIDEDVASDATAVFRLLGEAEARVHGTDLEETHFHEVGADDAIADIVGVSLLFDDLDADRVVTTPVSVGGGETSMSHGVYPVPTPAVTYLVESASWCVRGGPLDTELLTPTGAALLAHFAEGVDSLPSMRVERSGYGAGSKSFAEHPNVLRATVGETEGGLVREEIRVLETNLDDATPEVLGGLQSSLKEAGARDVSILSATMKKSRPGHLVKVIVRPEDVQSVVDRLAEETGTLGVRETGANHRWVAERTFETVEIDVDAEAFEVTVKVARDADGNVYDASAEYDDAATVAERAALSTREVIRRAEAAYFSERSR